MKIAVVGDIHGLQRQMYEAVSDLDVDMILQVGDFQAVRDQKDLTRLQVPGRYKQLGEYPYYHAQGQVPINTWFIGGNHDNDYWHSAFPQGHELITGLHYLGRAGVKKFDDLVVGWISGNYSPKSYIGTRKKYEYHQD